MMGRVCLDSLYAEQPLKRECAVVVESGDSPKCSQRVLSSPTTCPATSAVMPSFGSKLELLSQPLPRVSVIKQFQPQPPVRDPEEHQRRVGLKPRAQEGKGNPADYLTKPSDVLRKPVDPVFFSSAALLWSPPGAAKTGAIDVG